MAADERAGRLTQRLDILAPYPLEDVLRFHGRRAIAGTTAVDEHGLRTIVDLGHGPRRVNVAAVAGSSALELSSEALGPDESARLEAHVRRAFDVDMDPAAVDAVLASDPMLAASVAALPGRRLPGSLDPWATLVLAIATQGVSLEAARSVVTRLVDRVGAAVPRGDDTADLVRAFPTARRLADADPATLTGVGLGARGARTVRAVAEVVAAGGVDLDGDPAAMDAGLAAIPGIGPWTRGYTALRIAHDRDAFPVGDAAIRAAFRRRGLAHDDRSIARVADAWRPWRGYAVMHLWAEPTRRAEPTRPVAGTRPDADVSAGRSPGR